VFYRDTFYREHFMENTFYHLVVDLDDACPELDADGVRLILFVSSSSSTSLVH
jgi:hypothetical protein